MGYLERTYHATDQLNRRRILAAVKRQPGATLLDLGCAEGGFTMKIAAAAGAERVIGVELVEHFAAQARAKGIEVIGTDLGQRLPLDDSSVDIVHSNQVIEHLRTTDTFLAEIRRVLRPGGYAIVSTNNLASWHNIVSLALGWQPPVCHVSDEVITGNPVNFADGREGAEGLMHLRIFTARALADLARFHGLETEHAETVGYYPLPPRVARLMTRVDPRHGAFLVQRYRPTEPDPRSSVAPLLLEQPATAAPRSAAPRG